ncbi:hypothetical protein [Novosphingobium sp. NBM11]|uniref:hypothetical protein n=1 Tax=Novosphingobium sp. NBM11 TaxID=2596914 RepID=UPI0028154CFD|nr:hypothetical protein [Novosphingobium sp. NBM11]
MNESENEAATTVLGGRRVQFEMFFTLPDFSDISLRDYQETMQRPFFSLSKKKAGQTDRICKPGQTGYRPRVGQSRIWHGDDLGCGHHDLPRLSLE